MQYTPRKYYFDKLKYRVGRPSEIFKEESIQPFRHPERFIYIGEWCNNQKIPYVNMDGFIVRDYHKGEQIVFGKNAKEIAVLVKCWVQQIQDEKLKNKPDKQLVEKLLVRVKTYKEMIVEELI